jgi:hypothetical protein
MTNPATNNLKIIWTEWIGTEVQNNDESGYEQLKNYMEWVNKTGFFEVVIRKENTQTMKAVQELWSICKSVNYRNTVDMETLVLKRIYKPESGMQKF